MAVVFYLFPSIFSKTHFLLIIMESVSPKQQVVVPTCYTRKRLQLHVFALIVRGLQRPESRIVLIAFLLNFFFTTNIGISITALFLRARLPAVPLFLILSSIIDPAIALFAISKSFSVSGTVRSCIELQLLRYTLL